MATEGDQAEPIMGDPATNGRTGHADLIEQAKRLGQQHRAAGIAPFGDADHVFWDEGSARLLDALSVTSPTTDDNAPGRFHVAAAYCDALGAPRGRRDRARLLTVPGRPGIAQGVLAPAEDGEPDSW